MKFLKSRNEDQINTGGTIICLTDTLHYFVVVWDKNFKIYLSALQESKSISWKRIFFLRNSQRNHVEFGKYNPLVTFK